MSGTSISNVTLRRKRYTGPRVFVCAGCNLLAIAERSDQTTCSTACRVRAHRNGKLELLREQAVQFALVDTTTGKPQVSLQLQAQAIYRLLPDLSQEIAAGTLTIAQAQPAAVREFWKRLREHLDAPSSEARA